MKPVIRPLEMRVVDDRAIAEIGLASLIDRAGFSAALAAKNMLGGLYGRRIVIVAGKGHNGDDGRRCAHYLRARGALVEIVDPTHEVQEITQADLVIDAAYGTGFHGNYHAPVVPRTSLVLALDIPSGVDGVTGVACDGAVRADVTLTFGALKPGMIFGDGPDHCGEVIVDEIGLVIDEAESWLVEESDLVNVLGRRAHNAHKWQRGVVLVAGSAGMPGAAKLCSLAALRAGASMLRVGAPGVAPGEFGVTEAVALSLPSQGVAHALEDELHRAKAIIIGPGLGSDPHVVAEVRELVSSVGIAMVLDADALNALGEIDDKTPSLFSHNDCVVLTPHEGEFRRLTGHPPGADRVSSVREFARNAHAVVLLKGATTVVVGPTGPALLVNSGTSALATAGTGDVLSGVIGAFLARGLVPLEAAAFAAYLHGRAGALASQEGLIASDLPALIANVIESESHYAEPRIRAIDG